MEGCLAPVGCASIHHSQTGQSSLLTVAGWRLCQTSGCTMFAATSHHWGAKGLSTHALYNPSYSITVYNPKINGVKCITSETKSLVIETL